MDPWALLMLLIGGVLVVTGFRGHQDNIIAGVTGKAYRGSTLQ